MPEPTELSQGPESSVTYTFFGIDRDGDFVERDYVFKGEDYPRGKRLRQINKDAKHWGWTMVNIHVKAICYARS